MKHRRRHLAPQSRGVTLIEVMIVAAIVGVLAALAVFGVRRWIASSHVAEATEMVQAIGGAQEQYRAEAGAYANVSAGLANADLCPAYVPGMQGTWNSASCPSAAGKTWKSLNVVASKQLWYGYATFAGAPGTDPSTVLPAVSIKGSSLNFAGMNGGTAAPAPYFSVVARGDTDKNGVYATVFYASFARSVLVDNDSE